MYLIYYINIVCVRFVHYSDSVRRNTAITPESTESQRQGVVLYIIYIMILSFTTAAAARATFDYLSKKK